MVFIHSIEKKVVFCLFIASIVMPCQADIILKYDVDENGGTGVVLKVFILLEFSFNLWCTKFKTLGRAGLPSI